MDDLTLKGVGIWILALLEAVVVFIAFLLGKVSNGFPAEFSLFIGSILVSTQVLIVLIVKRYFKIEVS